MTREIRCLLFTTDDLRAMTRRDSAAHGGTLMVKCADNGVTMMLLFCYNAGAMLPFF